MRSEIFTTIKVLLTGLVLGILVNLPFYAWIFNKKWDWATGFPLSWLGAGMVYMGTFFHEIGHTFFAWYYGYPTIPMFDFQHGGGLALALSGQQIGILIFVWAGFAFGIWYFRENLGMQIFLGLMLILNFVTAFNRFHTVGIDFGGPAFEPLIAGFLLFRAIFDLAPRGIFERFLNAFFGFGLIIQVFINGYGLLKSQAFRLVYYEQKGAHGFGDFDKIATALFWEFEEVVMVWVLLTGLCLVIPFLLTMFISTNKIEEF